AVPAAARRNPDTAAAAARKKASRPVETPRSARKAKSTAEATARARSRRRATSRGEPPLPRQNPLDEGDGPEGGDDGVDVLTGEPVGTDPDLDVPRHRV